MGRKFSQALSILYLNINTNYIMFTAAVGKSLTLRLVILYQKHNYKQQQPVRHHSLQFLVGSHIWIYTHKWSLVIKVCCSIIYVHLCRFGGTPFIPKMFYMTKDRLISSNHLIYCMCLHGPKLVR